MTPDEIPQWAVDAARAAHPECKYVLGPDEESCPVCGETARALVAADKAGWLRAKLVSCSLCYGTGRVECDGETETCVSHSAYDGGPQTKEGT